MKLKQGANVKNFEDYKRKNEVERLRSLVLGDEFQEALETLVSREDDEERVADVVSEAIKKRSARDRSLTSALAPVVDRAIQKSIDENPKRIINVIFPILGPAVRKAVSAALTDMVQSLNSVLEQSLNFKSVWWRIQAARAGMPYAQYVLLNTLKFRVEQVLLVHRETGMLLHHVAQPGIETQDPELVSSMLTAITDFVSDSFTQGSNDTLEGVRFGEFSLHIEIGPHAIIATAVRGTLSESARPQFSETLEQIHMEFSEPLKKFSGDRAPFAEVDSQLKSCLLSQSINDSDRPKVPVAALICIILALGWFSYRMVAEYDLRTDYDRIVKAYANEPGYVLLNHVRVGTVAEITLLRDTQATPLQEFNQQFSDALLAVSITATDIVFEPELRDPVPVVETPAQPIETLLGDFDKVTTETQNGILRLSGVITQETLNRILSDQSVDQQYQGIDVSDAQIVASSEAELSTAADLEAYAQVVKAISGQSFYFELNSLAFAQNSQETLIQVVKDIATLVSLHQQLNLPNVELLIVGFADSQGTETTNNLISQQRANYVRDLLVANGVSADLLVSWGAGHIGGSSLTDDAQRRATIEVTQDIKVFANEVSP